MTTLPIRLRRNRQSPAIRSLLQETRLHPSDFVVPLFLIEGSNLLIPIPSMPNINRYSLDLALAKATQLHASGIQSIALFPVIDPSLRSPSASEAWNPNGLLARAIRLFKTHLPSLCLIADVALDPFTSHGHDGLADPQGNILNDPTIDCLIKMSLMQASLGVDYVAPSDMMDGRIAAIRSALDAHNFLNTGILAYSAKYASSLYAPFRTALNTQLAFGDKRTYQLNPANAREALLEATLDLQEGADILLVKPATLYLDILSRLRSLTHRPLAAYHVSGEYSMVLAAHNAGYLSAPQVFHETLLSIKRAGADLIFTYAAEYVLDQM